MENEFWRAIHSVSSKGNVVAVCLMMKQLILQSLFLCKKGECYNLKIKIEKKIDKI